ncbi:histidine phosphatase family protein [Glycomyces harbinensis]|uniref:Probable phosphoglycerate mutase n=1 Tax=Glycomyces harbinensis TaxID=58114 RepID=A0A1G7DZV3_9ACTN|nr:histidine phosphatase family protein [Glycomyces harbinensis]SDE56780.1 probable phosphoglycerate mutase [Glycomyces harbinensis]
MNRLLIVRHGQTEWNIAGRIQGSSDIDLDETGKAQAAEAAPELAAYEPTRIISSDLRRAVDTARPVADITGVEVELDKRLRERAYGPWEGLTHHEIADRFPEDHRRWRSQEPLQHPDIETWAELHRRTSEAVRDIVESDVEGTAIVVCHGGSARQIIGGILDWEQGPTSSLSGMDNAHWADLRQMRSGKWRLYGYNLGVPDPSTIGQSLLAKGQQAGR